MSQHSKTDQTTKPQDLHPIALKFSRGIDNDRPEVSTVHLVDRITRTVEEETESFVHSVDVDGAFSFDAQLRSGLFIMCEIDTTGEINAGLYQGPFGDMEKFLARTTEEELLPYFQDPRENLGASSPTP